ncbi:hypothetical protein P389DRAFT_169102 [Cystobasidium minutum MCA 4210]|uniref:uncharacterized protein n=1 Tax=Cystobasidium minutum MCA 4210 TaxID=1397322 RepID=UPI0034CE373C|eukprot:jgi/Rhomi1/169102/fgenesh1_kg.3_\
MEVKERGTVRWFQHDCWFTALLWIADVLSRAGYWAHKTAASTKPQWECKIMQAKPFGARGNPNRINDIERDRDGDRRRDQRGPYTRSPPYKRCRRASFDRSRDGSDRSPGRERRGSPERRPMLSDKERQLLDTTSPWD